MDLQTWLRDRFSWKSSDIVSDSHIRSPKISTEYVPCVFKFGRVRGKLHLGRRCLVLIVSLVVY